MNAGLRAQLGCWLHERWRAEVVLRAPSLAARVGTTWRDLRNRHETLEAGEGGARACVWSDSSFLTVARVDPRVGGRLLAHCLAEHPVSFQPRPRGSSPPRLSVVLPVAGADRLDAFGHVLRSLLAQTLKPLEILLVEHSAQPLYAGFGEEPRVRHIHLPRDAEAAFNKSRSFNVGVAEARAPFVLLNDADVVVPEVFAEDVLLRLDAGWEAVRPTRFVFLLNREASRSFADEDGVAPAEVSDVMQNFDGLSTALSRETYDAIGGHDERFEGWGGEDTEFLQRLKTRKLFPGGYTYSVHLWHPPAPKYASGHRNRDIFEEITREPPELRIEGLRARAGVAR